MDDSNAPQSHGPATSLRFWLLIGFTLATWIAAAVMQMRIPAHKRRFDEYGLSLSEATKEVFRFNFWLQDNWSIVALQFIAMFCGFSLVYLLLRGRVIRRWIAALWLVLLILLPAAVTLCSFIAIELAAMKLREALAN